MSKHTVSAESIIAAEKQITDFLAAEAAPTAEKSQDAEEVTLRTIFDAITASKSLPAATTAPAAERGPGEEEEEDDEDARHFTRKSLQDVEHAPGASPQKTALDVSRWLDGMATVMKSLKPMLGQMIANQETLLRQNGLLLNLGAVQAKKALDAKAAEAAKPADRASTLSVLDAPQGRGAAEAPDYAKLPGPQEFRRLALKALNAGKITPAHVSLVETYVNGIADAGIAPQPPPKELLDIVLSERVAA